MPITIDGEIWLNTRETMAFLGISSRDTLRNYVKVRKVLHPRKQVVGSSLWYSQSELSNLKKLHEVEDSPVLEMPLMMKHFDTFIESKGLTPLSSFVGEPQFLSAPTDIAKRLDVPPGTMVVRRLLKQGGKDQDHEVLWRVSENWYHPQFVDEAMLSEMKKSPRFDTMLAIKERYGKTVHYLDIEMTARTPTIVEQDLLDISPGEPMLELWRVNRTVKDGEIVMLQHLAFIGKRTRLVFPIELDLWDQVAA